MAAIHWLAVNPATGLPIAELPGLRCESTLTTIMGATGGTVNVALPIADRLPSNWRQATQPHRTVIIAQYDDPDETVVWAGIPIIRTHGSGPTIDLTLIDAHGYLDRQHNDYVFDPEGWDAADVAAGIFNSGMIDYLPGAGNTTLTGTTIDFSWPVDESAYRALTRLAETGTVEWTAEWRWVTPDVETEWGFTRRLWTFLTVAPRVGRRATATVQPHLLSRVAWTQTEDWGSGRGADQVVAVGQSSGDEPPPTQRFPDTIPFGEQMRLVETVSVNSDNTTALLGEAQRKWAELSQGTTVHDVSLIIADSDIILGKTISIGDDVVVDLANPDLPGVDHSFEARMVGWTAEPDPDSGQITTLKPILVDREA